jgi:UDP-N-acetylmuramyl pentapeptide phosphotransferase/UDP-N-acetylglucosamine-1-phosphate transferase
VNLLPQSLSILAGAASALLVASWLSSRFARPGSPFHVLDHPNERSLHARPTPRSGGAAIAFGIVAGVLVSGAAGAIAAAAPGLVPGFIIVAAVSLIEDRRGVPIALRLLAHLAAALLLVRGGLTLSTLSIPGLDLAWPVWLGTGATVLYTAWMINLYNFMDGIDGLAGGMAVIGFGGFAVLGLLAGSPPFAIASIVVAAAAAGFLVFNFPPARCFMGDAGSCSLGFLAAGFALWGSYQWIIPLWISVLLFSPFILDATLTLLRRIVRGERFWEPHDSHYYQRLVRLGWTHRQTVLAEYGAMLLCAGAGMLALRAEPFWKWVILGCVALGYAVGIALLTRAERAARRGRGARLTWTRAR